jgi:hypothetical protein
LIVTSRRSDCGRETSSKSKTTRPLLCRGLDDPWGRNVEEPGPVEVEREKNQWEIEKFVDRKLIRPKGKPSFVKYLVKLTGYSSEYNEWKKRSELILTAPKAVEQWEEKHPAMG